MSRQEDRSRRSARYVIARRDQLGISQEALADRAGLNHKTVHTLETGKHRPVAKTQEKVEAALGWEPGDIARIADGGFPITGPLPADDPDGLIAAAMAGDPDDLEPRIRAVIADLPEPQRSVVEELYEQLLDSERQRRRLLNKLVPPADRATAAGESPGSDGRVVDSGDALHGRS